MSTDNKKQQAFDKRYLRMARIWAENSYCQRRKVGALIVKDNAIISDGYNGTPSGSPTFVKTQMEIPFPTCFTLKPMPSANWHVPTTTVKEPLSTSQLLLVWNAPNSSYKLESNVLYMVNPTASPMGFIFYNKRAFQ